MNNRLIIFKNDYLCLFRIKNKHYLDNRLLKTKLFILKVFSLFKIVTSMSTLEL